MNAVTQNEEQNAGAVEMPVTAASTRPFYWSVRRELWEHRALWMAPLIAAGLILLSFIVPAVRMLTNGQAREWLSSANDARPLDMMASGLYGTVAAVIFVTTIIVVWFYCLDALFSERRDRSILFWKSLPVSDVTTVTSKLFVASAVAPSISFVVVVASQLVILLIGSAIILIVGGSPAGLWSPNSLFSLTVAFLYGLVTHAIWFAPLLGWLIFVSAWARRSPTFWAVMVPAGICLVERIALGTNVVFSTLLTWLTTGFTQAAFDRPVGETVQRAGGFSQFNFSSRVFDAIDPVKFLSTPGVWIGLVIAAAFVAATVWMRRYREPL